MANSQTSLRRTSQRRASIPTVPILKTDCFTHSSSFEHQPCINSRNHGQGTQSTSWLRPNLGPNAAPGKRTGTSEGRRLLLSRRL